MLAREASKYAMRAEPLLALFREEQAKGSRHITVTAYTQIGDSLDVVEARGFSAQRPLMEWMRRQRKEANCHYFGHSFNEALEARGKATSDGLQDKADILNGIISRKGLKVGSLGREIGVTPVQVNLALNPGKVEAMLDELYRKALEAPEPLVRVDETVPKLSAADQKAVEEYKLSRAAPVVGIEIEGGEEEDILEDE